MPVLCLTAVLMVAPAEPPSGPALGPPVLTRGDRIPFAGRVTDESSIAGQGAKRTHQLDVTLFVLDISDRAADCAVFTRLVPESDPGVVAAAAHVLGTPANGPAAPALIRLDRVRIDARGTVSRLPLPGRPPPFPTDFTAATLPSLPMPLDGPPLWEWGMFLPRPESPAPVGATWTAADGDRPARQFTVRGTDRHNGGLGLVIDAVQKSAGYDDLTKVAAGWQRYDRSVVSSTDGLAREVERRIVHREGNAAVRTIAVRYEAKPVVPHADKSYRDVRLEIETAVWLAGELDKALGGPTPDPAAVDRVRDRAKRFEEDRPGTAFRPAVEAVRRRAEAALAGRALGDR